MDDILDYSRNDYNLLDYLFYLNDSWNFNHFFYNFLYYNSNGADNLFITNNRNWDLSNDLQLDFLFVGDNPLLLEGDYLNLVLNERSFDLHNDRLLLSQPNRHSLLHLNLFYLKHFPNYWLLHNPLNLPNNLFSISFD